MEKKYIHYCWFGDKPLPKLAKKCIKSWQKYLPDYEIIKWSEENFNIEEECTFVKEAYKCKKWAFVSDYVRTKALNEMGGIYFDTDMEVTKDISSLLEHQTFLGIEDTGFVAVGVWYEQEKNSFLTSELLKIYRKFKSFDVDNLGDFSIPKLISRILDDYGFVKGKNELQILHGDIYIYPRDYFYPYSYNWENNVFTDNTCMIHYYDASWIPLKDKIEINMVRKVGKVKTYKILEFYRKIKFYIKKLIKLVLFPLVLYRNYKKKKLLITEDYLNRIENTIFLINGLKEKEYITFYNKEWLGVTSATKELFDNLVDCGELYRKKDIKRIANAVISANVNQVVFSSFAVGWKTLVKCLKHKNKSIKIKTFWHGSHSQIMDYYGWQRNVEIIKLHKKGYIDGMATCKKSLLNFYKKEKYNADFLTNIVNLENNYDNENNKEIRIGLYAAKCNDWRKNMFSQMAAVSLIDNAVLDMVPLNDTAIEFAKTLNLKLDGVNRQLSREEILERMSKNTVNLYVTYSECAPMLPLESMENNVVCISGNNHHYFENTELEKHIVVNNEEDVNEIKDKILNAINNSKKIIKLYKDFSKKNKESSKKQIKKYLGK